MVQCAHRPGTVSKAHSAAATLPLAEGSVWGGFFSHIGNLYSLHQVKKLLAIKALVEAAKMVVDVFRIPGMRKIFLRCMTLRFDLRDEHNLHKIVTAALVVVLLTVRMGCQTLHAHTHAVILCGYTKSELAQLQLPIKVRFSSNANMCRSVLQHRVALCNAVATSEYVEVARKVDKRKKSKADTEYDSEDEMLELEKEVSDRVFEDVVVPVGLTGRFATVFQTRMSTKFWGSLQV